MRGFTESLESGFTAGVVTATDASLLDLPAASRAWNAVLGRNTAGKPYLARRAGLGLYNATPISGSPAILGQYDFTKTSTGTSYHLLYSADGRLSTLNSDSTTTSVSTAFTAGTYYPDFETARDLCVIANGQEIKKYNGSAVQTFGITRPTVGSLAASAGAAGTPNGTYELRCTYYNSATGHESSASDTASATVTVTNQQLSWTGIPTSADTQVTTVYLYVRNTATENEFWQVGSVANGVTTATTNVADTAHTVVAPDTSENDPPVSGIKFCCYHQGRLFLATGTDLYWSKIGDVESFDPDATDPVNRSDGQSITGLHSDHEVLLIFKEDRTYGIFGASPDTWEIRLLDADIGTGSHRTITSAASWTWWWSRQGLVRWAGSTIERIGLQSMGPQGDYVNYAQIARASVGYDKDETRLVFALPNALEDNRANRLVAFNVSSGIMESDWWDPMDAASLATIYQDGHAHIHLGNYAGQVFDLSEGTSDGVPSGTDSGTFVATGTTLTSITDATAAFLATGGKLIERKVTILDENGLPVTGDVRPYITANTATTLTLSSTVSGLRSGHTYTYLIGVPNFQWISPQLVGGEAWTKKRFEYLFCLFEGSLSDAGAAIDVAYDGDADYANPSTITFGDSPGTWDTALWDDFVWDAPNDQHHRERLGRVGFSYQIRIRHTTPSASFSMLKLGVRGTFQTTKR